MELEYGKNLHTLDISYQSKTYQLEGRLPPLVIFLRRNMKRLILSGIDSMKRPSSSHNNRDITLHRQGGLSYLEYRDNNLEYLSLTIRYPNSTVPLVLDFSRNKIAKIDLYDMKRNIQNGTIIDQLLLSENNLGQFMSNDSVPQFAFYKDLRRLDLSLNRIKSLPPMIFNNLTNLEYLNLSSNSLIFVDFVFSNLNKVRTIDISNNLLVQLSRKVRDQVDDLRTKSNNFSMNLSGNPFQCSCDTIDFLQWILSRRPVFAYFDQYTCIFQSSVRSFEELHHMLGDLHFQCATHLIVKATAGFLSFVVLIIAVSLVLYRHK